MIDSFFSVCGSSGEDSSGQGTPRSEENRRRQWKKKVYLHLLNLLCYILCLFSNLPFNDIKCLFPFHYLNSSSIGMEMFLCDRIIALRKAEKDEEKRAREKIRQKLEEDKVKICLTTVFNIVQKFSVLRFWVSIVLSDVSLCSVVFNRL